MKMNNMFQVFIFIMIMLLSKYTFAQNQQEIPKEIFEQAEKEMLKNQEMPSPPSEYPPTGFPSGERKAESSSEQMDEESDAPAPSYVLPMAPAPMAPPAPNNGASAVTTGKDSLLVDGEKAQAAPLLPTSRPVPYFSFDPTGKRDPFKAPKLYRKSKMSEIKEIDPLQNWSLDSFKVTGIIWGVKTPKAVVVDPQGRSYVVKKNTLIGKNKGYVTVIREGEIVVVETIDDDAGLRKEVKILEFKK